MAPFKARYAARAMLAACPALLLQFAPAPGAKLPTGTRSESSFVDSAVEPVWATSAASNAPAVPPEAFTLAGISIWSSSSSSLTAWMAVR